MREPERGNGGDAGPDRSDVFPTAETGALDVPADGDAALPRAPGPAEEADPDPDPDPCPGADPDALGEVPDFPGDDVLFDPLLSDEPIDLAAVRADDALIDALGGGDLDAAHDLIDPDDPLIALLAAWAAFTRPDEGPCAGTEPEPELCRPSLRLVDSPASGTGATADAAAAEAPAGPDDAPDPAATPDPAEIPAAAVAVAPDTVTRAAATPGTVRRLVPPVLGVLHRARAARRRTGARDRPPPAVHPLRRAAVAVVVTALGVSAAAAAGGTARPGDAGFAMTRVFFAEKAESLKEAEVVAEGLDRARAYIAQRQPALAAQELADAGNRLPAVRDEEGHTKLAAQQQELAARVALTPPDPRGTGPTRRDVDPDTAILADAAPSDTAPPDVAPPDVAQPDVAQPDTAQPDTAPDTPVPGTAPGAAGVVTSPSKDAAPGVAPAPGAGPTAQEPGAQGDTGTATTPPGVGTAPVGGANDPGTGTADPTATNGTSAGDTTSSPATSAPATSAPATSAPATSAPATSAPATSAPATSAPGDPASATSRTSTPKPPTGTRAPVDDGDTAGVAEPAGHTHAAGSVTASSADGAGAPVPAVRAVLPEKVAHRAPVVFTTVPRPAAGVDGPDPDGAKAEHSDRHVPAGARLSGVGEIRPRSGTG